MQIVVLLGFVVSLILAEPEMLGQLAAPSRWVGPAIGVYLAVGSALTALDTSLSVREIRRGGWLCASAARRHGILVVAFRCWLVLGMAALMASGYGQWVVAGLLPFRIPLLAKAAVLAPFILAILIGWLLDYPYHLAVRERLAALVGEDIAPAARPYWTRREHVSYNARHHLLFIAVPVGLILLCSDVLEMYVAGALGEPLGGTVQSAGTLTAAAGVFLVAPAIIIRIWRTGRLAPGALRSDLEAMCEQLKLRYRDILVWRTGGIVANAGVMGLTARWRYILISDGILEKMDPPYIKAIFAHEGGHVVSHHILYSVIFGIGSILLCISAGEVLTAALEWDIFNSTLLTLAMLAGAWAFGFGFISRRFERQSDVAGAWASVPPDDGSGRITPEGAAVFARALERVAELNGIPPRQHNWRHGSIAARVSYVLWLGSTAGTRDAADRTVRRIKLALWAVLAAATGITVLQYSV